MKVESLVPTYIENFTNLQSEYFRIARDFFGTCYIVEKELLDKIGVDQKAIEGFDKYLRVFTKSAISEIEVASNFQKTIVNNTMSVMKSYDEYVKLMLSSYAKMLEYTSALIPKKTQ
jgi:glutathione peroxidase-family protein